MVKRAFLENGINKFQKIDELTEKGLAEAVAGLAGKGMLYMSLVELEEAQREIEREIAGMEERGKEKETVGKGERKGERGKRRRWGME